MGKRKKPNPSEYCIYLLENTANQKKYIGQTQDLSWRKVTHRGKLKLGQHPNYKLQEDWDKYGEKAFKYTVLEYCDRSIANEREMYYIALYDTVNAGYNISIGGTNGNNFPRKKIKQYDLNGNFIREWDSAADAARAYNVKRTYITNAVKHKKMFANSQWCYIDENIDGYYCRKGQRPIIQYDLKGNVIKVYKTAKDVEAQNNMFNSSFISYAALSDSKDIAYGYRWKYGRKEDYNEYFKQSS